MNGQEFRVSEVLACPLCKCRMLATPGSAAKCQRCDVVFPALRGTWDLVPYEKVSRDPLWRSWSQTQENGSAAYRSDPTSNLSLGNNIMVIIELELSGSDETTPGKVKRLLVGGAVSPKDSL